MPYQFCCPQGHILQGELSIVGQIMRCPMCGSDFHVPPPDTGAVMSQGFAQGPGMWPAPGGPSGYSVPVSEQHPAGGYPPPAYPAPQYGSTTAGSAPTSLPAPRPPESPPATSSVSVEGPRFDLGFDPFAKASLPFELPGHGETDTGTPTSSFLAGPAPVAPDPASAFSPQPTSWGSAPAAQIPRADVSPANVTPGATSEDFLAGAAPASEAPVQAAPPPKMLHIRCPSGHVVKAPSELLGKLGRCPACKQTFELRYENSLEFKRRTEKILNRDEDEAGRTRLGWIFVAAFLVFVALVGAVLIFGRSQ